MARTVYGKVTDRKGKAIAGLKVEAWDSDWPDPDQRMGVTYTDAKGKYALHYRGGHWDPAPHRITTWRPDIYVTVGIKNRVGRWVQLAKSRTYKNHKLKSDRKINLAVDIQPPKQKRTTFQVMRQGFRFANSFVVRDVLGIEGPWHMGFCGGMSAGALHRYSHRCAVPRQTRTPKDGEKLFKELEQRQWDTLPAGIVTKIYDWQRSPDLPHRHTPHSIRFRQKEEWAELQKLLDKGKPAVLVLIRMEGYLANISRNHQVLAIGYEYNPANRDLTIEVYDPNDSGGSNFLDLCLGGGRLAARQRDSAGRTIGLRGFFVNDAGAGASKKHYG